MKRKEIYKGAVVLLIAVFMVMSTIPAIADDDVKPPTDVPRPNEDGVLTSANAEGHYIDSNVINLPYSNLQELPTNTFGEFTDIWLLYHDNIRVNALGLTSGGTMYWAVVFAPAQLAGYDGYEIDAVRQYFYSGNGAGTTANVNIFEGDLSGPITNLGSESFGTVTPTTPDGTGFGDWFTIAVDPVITIDETKTYWVIVDGTHGAGTFPAAFTNGPSIAGQSDSISLDGISYQSMSVYGFYGDWMLEMGIKEGGPGGPTAGCDFAVEINSPCGIVNSDPKVLNISVFNYGEDGISEVKVLADIYKEVPGGTSNVCCQDVEGDDPLNWMVVDNGDGDSWTVSEDRYHSEGHSWRNTAGRWRDPCGEDPDCYLGHAADSGPDELILTACQDLAGAEYGWIEFWDWCVGEYTTEPGYLMPTDFGTIAISNDCGQTWVDIPQSQFVAYDNDWRETIVGLNTPDHLMDTVDFNVDIELTDQMSIKFIWTSDPHMQYEGWYIDDVCFYRGEPSTWEIVWQGHNIFWDIPPMQFDPIYFEFPLDWDPVLGEVYKIVVCGQVFDPAGCDENPFNDCDECYVELLDLCDVASVSTTGPMAIEICDSPVYEVTIENLGTYPAVGFPVNLEVARMASDLWFSGFEGGDPGFIFFYYSVYPALSHVTDCDDFVYEGGSALAIATEDCSFPTVTPMEFDMVVSQDVFDLSGDNIVGAELRFFAKYSLSEQITSAPLYDIPTVNCLGEVNMPDHWFITIQNPTIGYYIIRCTSDTYNSVYVGENGQWEGHYAEGKNPGMFTMDLLDMMDQVGSLFDNKQVSVGFGLITNDDEYILNPVNPWSGLFIDNVEVVISYCDASTGKIVNTTIAPFLDIGDSATVEMGWDDACDYSSWCVSGITDLDCDEVPENDKSSTITKIMESGDDPEWETIDLTDTGGDCGWIIVSKNPCDTFSEPPEDQYFWCGNPDTGVYDPYMNDELVSEVFDLSGYDAGILQFDTYYDIEAGYDYGKLFYSDDAGAHWYELAFYEGFANWHIETYMIPAATANMKIKFQFISDNVYEFNGWYVDDVVIKGATYGVDACLDFSPADIPAGWTQTQYAGTGVWEIRDDSYMDPYSWDGTTYAVADSDNNPSDVFDVELFTPSIDMTGETWVTFEADTNFQDFAGDGYMEVNVYSAGSLEILLESKTTDDPSGGVHRVYSFDPSLFADPSDVQFGFLYSTEGGTYAWGFSIDNIDVYGTTTLFQENFNGGAMPWMFDPAHPSNWGIYSSTYAGGTAPEARLYWSPSFVGHTFIELGPLDTTTAAAASVSMKYYVDWYGGTGLLGIESSLDGVTWVTNWETVLSGNVAATTASAGILTGSPTTYVRIYYDGDTYNFDYIYFDDICYTEIIEGDIVFEDDAESGLDKWTCENAVAGDWWQEVDGGPCDDTWWNGDDLTGMYVDGVQNVLFTEYDLSETDMGEPYYAAIFSYQTNYDFAWDYFWESWSDTYDYFWYATGKVQISTDYGSTWYTLREYRGSSGGWIEEEIDISHYLPNVIQIRFLFESVADAPVAGGWYVDCFEIMFKHEIYCDTTPPVTTICVDEEAAQATLTAYDGADYIVTGVRATYYILNGGAVTEYVGDAINLVEGSNTIEYWSVDKASDLQCADEDNVETHKTATVLIDTTAPTITITAPEDGKLYLFGNPIMDRIFGSGTLCIGGVTIEASASDSGTGVTMVTFDIDGDSGYDASAPYAYDFSKKFFGDVTVTATAFDGKGNTASDSTSFTIYSLGLF